MEWQRTKCPCHDCACDPYWRWFEDGFRYGSFGGESLDKPSQCAARLRSGITRGRTLVLAHFPSLRHRLYALSKEKFTFALKASAWVFSEQTSVCLRSRF